MTARKALIGAAAAAIAATFLLLPATAATAATAIPAAPTVEQPVVDTTHSLTPAQIDAIDQAAAVGHAKTGQETAVLLTDSLHGDAIEDYSIRVARAWGIGQTGADNGVLILVALADHKLRIEVGKGLEGDLPDITTGHIISDQMVPLIKTGDVAGALLAGVKAVQVGAATPAGAPQAAQSGDGPGDAFIRLVPAFVIIIGIIALMAVVVTFFGTFGSYFRWKKSTPARPAGKVSYVAPEAYDRPAGSDRTPSSYSRDDTTVTPGRAGAHHAPSAAGAAYLAGSAAGSTARYNEAERARRQAAADEAKRKAAQKASSSSSNSSSSRRDDDSASSFLGGLLIGEALGSLDSGSSGFDSGSSFGGGFDGGSSFGGGGFDGGGASGGW